MRSPIADNPSGRPAGAARARRRGSRSVADAALLAAIVDSSDDAIVSKDLNGVVATWNAGAVRLFGYAADEVVGKSITIIIPSDRQNEETEILSRIRRGERVEHYETVRRRKDGTLVDISLSVSPIRDAEGVVVGASKIARDITERKAADERQRLLAAEVDHRAKNVLAVVQAMVRLTRADSIAAYKEAIEGRIAALARAHVLLSASRWEGADLKQLVTEELAPYRKDGTVRLGAEGPALAITPAAAQSMAIVLHELATNAAKYGALSVPSGRIAVEWQTDSTGQLVLRWIETAGPPVKPPVGRGLGTSVIEQTIDRQLGGTIRLDWRADGLVCEIKVPAHKVKGNETAR